jgi:purine-nucleoside phosphorylase
MEKQFSVVFDEAVDEHAIGNTVLLPGDPLRAKFIADNFLQNAICYNNVRGMLGYTGTYKGKLISVQGTGMGIPSSLMYYHDLITVGQAKNLIRIGTAGSISKEVEILSVVLAMSASTTSGVNKSIFNGNDYAPTADFGLLKKSYDIAKEKKIKANVGRILTTDLYYDADVDFWKRWAEYGVVACDMETAGLYTIAAKYGVKALSILTISNSLLTLEETTMEDREKAFTNMMKIALEMAD